MQPPPVEAGAQLEPGASNEAGHPHMAVVPAEGECAGMFSTGGEGPGIGTNPHAEPASAPVDISGGPCDDGGEGQQPSPADLEPWYGTPMQLHAMHAMQPHPADLEPAAPLPVIEVAERDDMDADMEEASAGSSKLPLGVIAGDVRATLDRILAHTGGVADEKHVPVLEALFAGEARPDVRALLLLVLQQSSHAVKARCIGGRTLKYLEGWVGSALEPSRSAAQRDAQLAAVLSCLGSLPMDLGTLRSTGVGRVVGNLRKQPNAGVAAAAKTLVETWRSLANPATPLGDGAGSSGGGGTSGGDGGGGGDRKRADGGGSGSADAKRPRVSGAGGGLTVSVLEPSVGGFDGGDTGLPSLSPGLALPALITDSECTQTGTSAATNPPGGSGGGGGAGAGPSASAGGGSGGAPKPGGGGVRGAVMTKPKVHTLQRIDSVPPQRPPAPGTAAGAAARPQPGAAAPQPDGGASGAAAAGTGPAATSAAAPPTAAASSAPAQPAPSTATAASASTAPYPTPGPPAMPPAGPRRLGTLAGSFGSGSGGRLGSLRDGGSGGGGSGGGGGGGASAARVFGGGAAGRHQGHAGELPSPTAAPAPPGGASSSGGGGDGAGGMKRTSPEPSFGALLPKRPKAAGGKKRVTWVEEPSLLAIRYFKKEDPPMAARTDSLFTDDELDVGSRGGHPGFGDTARREHAIERGALQALHAQEELEGKQMLLWKSR
ncbi:hypothetical protein FOA52_011086 [Chlamydomonas sp. UWO 241]|nr:hypothetical protein FOA52_011086 [Chlamydomonas sp. UWO 241]